MIKEKKCKNCKDYFKPRTTLQKYCVKYDCIKEFISQQNAKEWKKRKVKMKTELMTLKDYIDSAQKVFNKWIRLRDKGLNCISCDKPIRGVKHASHYLSSGGHSSVRFNEKNVWVSCYKCNVMLSGNLLNYRKRLIEKIGLQEVEHLESIGYDNKKWTIEELKEIIKKYKIIAK